MSQLLAVSLSLGYGSAQLWAGVRGTTVADLGPLQQVQHVPYSHSTGVVMSCALQEQVFSLQQKGILAAVVESPRSAWPGKGDVAL
jgi:hypothetical protein